MTAKDIIYAKLDQIEWWWQKRLLNAFLADTKYHHYCNKCGGIMHYGVRFRRSYDYTTGQPYGVVFGVSCENYRDPSKDYYGHDIFEKFMFKSPFLIDYLRSNSYILGVQTILDVYEEEY